MSDIMIQDNNVILRTDDELQKVELEVKTT